MSPNAVVVCSNLYTISKNNWESKLGGIASDIGSNWNDQIATKTADEITVDSAPLASGNGTLNSPASSNEPVEYRDAYHAIIENGTNLFDTYDCVLVMTSVYKEHTQGIAYIGEPRFEDRPSEHEGKAAGSVYGLGVMFEPDKPSRTAYHEMLHTFSAIHEHGDEDNHWWDGRDSTVMSSYVSGCDGGNNGSPTKMNPSNCAEDAVNDYLDSWF